MSTDTIAQNNVVSRLPIETRGRVVCVGEFCTDCGRHSPEEIRDRKIRLELNNLDCAIASARRTVDHWWYLFESLGEDRAETEQSTISDGRRSAFELMQLLRCMERYSEDILNVLHQRSAR